MFRSTAVPIKTHLLKIIWKSDFVKLTHQSISPVGSAKLRVFHFQLSWSRKTPLADPAGKGKWWFPLEGQKLNSQDLLWRCETSEDVCKLTWVILGNRNEVKGPLGGEQLSHNGEKPVGDLPSSAPSGPRSLDSSAADLQNKERLFICPVCGVESQQHNLHTSSEGVTTYGGLKTRTSTFPLKRDRRLSTYKRQT